MIAILTFLILSLSLKIWEIVLQVLLFLLLSPYYLSSSDNPRVSLVVQHLTEENYSTWSRAVFIALDAKTKLGFIDGSIPKPLSVDHPCYIAWCKCNSTILAWLFNSVSKDLQPSIVYFKTTREVWLDLQHRFSQGNHQCLLYKV